MMVRSDQSRSCGHISSGKPSSQPIIFAGNGAARSATTSTSRFASAASSRSRRGRVSDIPSETTRVAAMTSGGGLQGQAFLITGGGSGIGYACAAALAAEGATVTICGRTEEKLAAAADALGVRHVVADV